MIARSMCDLKAPTSYQRSLKINIFWIKIMCSLQVTPMAKMQHYFVKRRYKVKGKAIPVTGRGGP
jgi:hypothetical protein